MYLIIECICESVRRMIASVNIGSVDVRSSSPQVKPFEIALEKQHYSHVNVAIWLTK